MSNRGVIAISLGILRKSYLRLVNPCSSDNAPNMRNGDGRMNVREGIQLFIKTASVERNLSENTLKAYGCDLKTLDKAYGGRG